ncbi:VanZ family protein [Kribbella sp. DT2]|uniref:VanZ family protein n=1 Tax=Kribbella sp. DT2 TaxID=3393427 RepID=UPI003CFB3D54
MSSRTWAWRAGFVLACLVQLYGLYSPQQAGPDTSSIPYSDKVAHFLIFAAVAYLGLRVGVPARWLLGALVLQAIGSEFIQHYLLPDRSGDPFDSVADLLGVALGSRLGFRAVQRARGRT